MNCVRAALAVICAVGLAQTGQCAAPQVQFDPAGAAALVAALDDAALDATGARRLVSLPGVRAMIDKTHDFDSAATPELFVTDLVAVAHDESLTHDPFQLMHVRDHQVEVRTLLASLAADPAASAARVIDRVMPFAPTGCRLAVQALLTAGGTSDGWSLAPGPGDAQRFAVALDQFRGDLAGVQLLMAHELFHGVQQCARRYDYTDHADEGSAALVMALLQSLEDEGTASLVGDATSWQGGGAYVEWFRGKFQRNLDRLPGIATVFSSLLYRAAQDPQAGFDDLYGPAFTGGWDSNAYFLGYHMAKVIDARLGRERLKALLSQSPAAFVTTYASVAAPGDPVFSAGTLALIRSADAATLGRARSTAR
jgi:Putative zinc dependent peptidase (DUF5700)